MVSKIVEDHNVTVTGEVITTLNGKWQWIRQGYLYFMWYYEDRFPKKTYAKVSGTVRELNIDHSARQIYLNVESFDVLEMPQESGGGE
jgi:hypothetical protein